MGGAKVQGIPVLVLACSYGELSPGVSGFRALEVLELVSAHWCVDPGRLLTDVCPLVGRAGLGPGHSGGQGQVESLFSTALWFSQS